MYNPNHDGRAEWGTVDSTITPIQTWDAPSDLEPWEDYSLQKWLIMFEGMTAEDREQYRPHIPEPWWPVLFPDN